MNTTLIKRKEKKIKKLKKEQKKQVTGKIMKQQVKTSSGFSLHFHTKNTQKKQKQNFLKIFSYKVEF